MKHSAKLSSYFLALALSAGYGASTLAQTAPGTSDGSSAMGHDTTNTQGQRKGSGKTARHHGKNSSGGSTGNSSRPANQTNDTGNSGNGSGGSGTNAPGSSGAGGSGGAGSMGGTGGAGTGGAGTGGAGSTAR